MSDYPRDWDIPQSPDPAQNPFLPGDAVLVELSEGQFSVCHYDPDSQSHCTLVAMGENALAVFDLPRLKRGGAWLGDIHLQNEYWTATVRVVEVESLPPRGQRYHGWICGQAVTGGTSHGG